MLILCVFFSLCLFFKTVIKKGGVSNKFCIDANKRNGREPYLTIDTKKGKYDNSLPHYHVRVYYEK